MKTGYAVAVTEKLFYQDPSLLEFDASILTYGPRGALHEVVLDRTCFFPGSGGQPADRGTLNGARVVELEDRDGEIVHVVDAALAAGPVHGSVDAARRRDYMAQHTGEHILAQALLRAGRLPTVSVHFGEETTTIELEAAVAPEEVLKKAEELANAVIRENRPVRIHDVDPAEASRFTLRRKPPEVGRLRIVDIDGWDAVGCSGVHVPSTGAVFMIKIVGQEKMRGHARIHAIIGERCIADYGRRIAMTQALSRVLTCGEESILARVEELVRNARERDREMKKIRVEQAVASARAAAETGRKTARALIIRGISDGAGPDYLQAFADEAISAPGRVAVAMDRTAAGFQWIVAHSLGAGLDLPSLLKPLLAQAGAKGGGKPAWMQGMGTSAEAAGAFADLVEEAIGRATV
ncbi:MAG TPA: hypothetical protein VMV03_11175 [Spirochaetia bacterium]|nr:hypothetical protein [Spirochaetia bacterium]